MPPPYSEFATWTLQDLAVRKKYADRITFEGNHVSAQCVLPVRWAGETPEQFVARKRKFWKDLPRHSDLSDRLALAFEAFRRAGENDYGAAYCVLKILREAPAQKRAEYERLGIGYAYRPIDSAFGATRRGRRQKRKRRRISPEERQAESIRAQASRFIRKRENYEALFLNRLESFKYIFWRDTEWYVEAEKSCLARVAAFEKLNEPFDWWCAMPLPQAAHLYHEQGKFPEALVYYRKAIDAARRAVMHQALRDFVVHWMSLGVELCLRSAKVVQMPAYRGPWLPENHPAPSPSTKAA
jgi:tetratricopeptide (TPR) repeat protein